MELREGIRIVAQRPRTWISDGVQLASDLEAPGYNQKAFIPRGFRDLVEAEKRVLLASDPSGDPSLHVGIVQLPESLRARIEASGIGQLPSLEEFIPFVQQTEYRELQRDLIDLGRQLLQAEDGFVVMSPTINPAGLPTVTLEGPSGKLLGMHLDSWDRDPLTERSNASNRVSINLGRESRYLLFINLPLKDILAALPEEERTDELAIPSFLKRYPNYPVVKVEVPSGCAYVAPTENMIHDGSTVDRSSSDIHLTMRGFFKVDLQAWAE